MKSTRKSRPAAHTHAAAAGGGIHLERSHGVRPKPVGEQGGFTAGIASAPRIALQRKQLHAAFGHAIQRQAGPEEEELLQGKFDPLQRQGVPEEEELLQGKFATVQRQGPEEEELLQGKFANKAAPVQLDDDSRTQENRTGMPDHLKAGIEALSGMDMSDVRVHYRSDQPPRLNALAYARGNEIHIGPGQEQHLPHEAWHLVQQRQGRVKPTMQARGIAINDDPALEHEADVMGRKALQMRPPNQVTTGTSAQATTAEQREPGPMEASEIPGGANGVSGEKVRLNFRSAAAGGPRVKARQALGGARSTIHISEQESSGSALASPSSHSPIQRVLRITSESGTYTYVLGKDFKDDHIGDANHAIATLKSRYGQDLGAFVTTIPALNGNHVATEVNTVYGYHWSLSLDVQGHLASWSDPGVPVVVSVDSIVVSGFNFGKKGKITHISSSS